GFGTARQAAIQPAITSKGISIRMAEKAGAVVLMSGGMDSAVCAAIAARDYQPAALHVSYGQRTEAREARAFAAVRDRLGIAKRLVIREESLRKIGGSALTDTNIAVPDAEADS